MTAFKNPTIRTPLSDVSDHGNLQSITEDTLRELIATGVVRVLQVIHHGNAGWAVLVRVGVQNRVVRSQRENIRTWRSLDTLASWAAGLGAVAIEVIL
jgi:hypothetical protein